VDTLNKISHEDSIVVISPLQRTLETITPFLEKFVGEKELSSLKSKYTEIQRTYQELRNNNELISYIKDTTTQKLFPLHDKVFVDFRHTDIITPEWQDTPCEI